MKGFKNTIYLHIGLPKTGTSALQVFFAKNRLNLRQQLGVRYPLNPKSQVGQKELITSGNAAKVALFAFSDNKQSLNLISLLENILKVSNDPVLFSSEYFCNWSKDRFIAFKDLANKYDFKIKIILYLRDQADLIVSHYFQLIKRRPGFDILEDFDDFAKKYINSHNFLDYYLLLENLESIFGKENLIVNVKNKDLLKNGDIIQDFMYIVFGIHDIKNFNRVSIINPTPNQQELYIKLLMNKFNPSLEFSDTYLNVISHLRNVKKEYDFNDNFLVDPATISYIRNYFYESNKLLCEKWFSNKAVEEVFEQIVYKQKKEYHNNTFNIKTLVEIFGGLLIEMFKKIEELEGRIKK